MRPPRAGRRRHGPRTARRLRARHGATAPGLRPVELRRFIAREMPAVEERQASFLLPLTSSLVQRRSPVKNLPSPTLSLACVCPLDTRAASFNSQRRSDSLGPGVEPRSVSTGHRRLPLSSLRGPPASFFPAPPLERSSRSSSLPLSLHSMVCYASSMGVQTRRWEPLPPPYPERPLSHSFAHSVTSNCLILRGTRATQRIFSR